MVIIMIKSYQIEKIKIDQMKTELYNKNNTKIKEKNDYDIDDVKEIKEEFEGNGFNEYHDTTISTSSKDLELLNDIYICHDDSEHDINPEDPQILKLT